MSLEELLLSWYPEHEICCNNVPDFDLAVRIVCSHLAGDAGERLAKNEAGVVPKVVERQRVEPMTSTLL